MKIIPKPITLTHRQDIAPIQALVTASDAPREITARRAYQHLVTSHNLYPEWVKRLLAIP